MINDLTDLLRQATGPAPSVPPVPRVVRGAAPRQASAAVLPAGAKPSGGGGGIASPLAEKGYVTRVYWPAIELRSTDGFITIEWLPPREVNFTDADGADVKIIYSQPA